jgi:hypothetical protein
MTTKEGLAARLRRAGSLPLALVTFRRKIEPKSSRLVQNLI